MSDVLFDKLYDESSEEFERATSYPQIGKFSRHTTPKVWRGGEWVEIDENEYRNTNEFKIIELSCSVDVKEFNPQSQYPYERRVQVNRLPYREQVEGGKPIVHKSDWFETFVPSLLKVTGMSDVKAALNFIDGKYVNCIDVPQQPTKQQPEPTYKTIKFVKIYASREEAYADYLANARQATGNATVETKTYSDEIVTTVRGMVNIPRYKNMNSAELAKEVGGDLTATDIENILKG